MGIYVRAKGKVSLIGSGVTVMCYSASESVAVNLRYIGYIHTHIKKNYIYFLSLKEKINKKNDILSAKQVF